MNSDISGHDIDPAFRRDQLALLVGLAVLAAVAWLCIAGLASLMSRPGGMAMLEPGRWSPGETAGLAVMWVIMMVAMMLPSAMPAIFAFADLAHRRAGGRTVATAIVFASGYLLPWAAFGVVAAVVHSALASRALLSPGMRVVSPALAGGLLIAAGIYQWLPFKARCLTRCRWPEHHLSQDWRADAGGALAMGLRQGSVCVECCWLLMVLLLVAGVMNLWWVAAIAGLVLLERVIPVGPAVGMLAGAVLAMWGVWLAVGA